ncbi:MAG: nucleotidyltransferase family protein [Deltaproteobacteria bacterium]|nr:nucleotidyltransferase family protein [Deltaproteobacteria bacterium]
MTRQQIIASIRANHALLEEFSVKSLFVFGSIVRGDTRPNSDVDMLVEFKLGTEIGLFDFIRLKNALSDLLDVTADLGMPEALHPALKDDILREAVHVA